MYHSDDTKHKDEAHQAQNTKQDWLREAFRLLRDSDNPKFIKAMRDGIRAEQLADSLAGRQKEVDLINERSADGKLYVEVWGRDCDMCESAALSVIPAYRMVLEMLEKRVYENSEGPTSITILTPEQAAEFEPYSRDRVLEAHENGSNYLV